MIEINTFYDTKEIIKAMSRDECKRLVMEYVFYMEYQAFYTAEKCKQSIIQLNKDGLLEKSEIIEIIQETMQEIRRRKNNDTV